MAIAAAAAAFTLLPQLAVLGALLLFLVVLLFLLPLSLPYAHLLEKGRAGEKSGATGNYFMLTGKILLSIILNRDTLRTYDICPTCG